MIATGFEPTTTQFVNEHSTIMTNHYDHLVIKDIIQKMKENARKYALIERFFTT